MRESSYKVKYSRNADFEVFWKVDVQGDRLICKLN